ncbi:MAG: type II toxin-antitoxin system VapC family toxin [Rubrobacteraceae bacterium]|jgi:predicted nucleic acid-binding protein|nr:type II toxin-antitoxin system VapC family toxin [Rubrobacter sp.]
MTQDPEVSRTLVLDTSVAVKFYVREEMHEEALTVLAAAESGMVELIAPDTIQPEFLNALWWKYRRGEFSREEVRKAWERFTEDETASLYAIGDLMPRAAGITLEIGVIVYDALFLTLAEEMDTTVVTADDKLLRVMKATKYSHLAQSLTGWTLDRR